jgi:hypothetical protein
VPTSRWDHGIAPFAAALAGVLLFMMALSALESRIKPQAPYDHRGRTEERVKAECSEVHGVDWTKCKNEIENAEAENFRSYEDLEAQQATAKWARWMTALGIISTVLTGIGIVLVWQTLRQSIAANHAAQKAIEVTRGIGEAQVRAYPSVVSVAITGVTNGLPAIGVLVKNSGNSPALRMKGRGQISLTYQEDVLPLGTRAQRGMSHEIVSNVQVPIPPSSEAAMSFHAPHGLGDEAAQAMRVMASKVPRMNQFWAVTINFDWVDVFGAEHYFYIHAHQYPAIGSRDDVRNAYSEGILRSPLVIDYQSESRQRERLE